MFQNLGAPPKDPLGSNEKKQAISKGKLGGIPNFKTPRENGKRLFLTGLIDGSTDLVQIRSWSTAT